MRISDWSSDVCSSDLVGYVPLVADIHFNYKCALAAAEAGADCLRINPGNIGSDKKVSEVIACARHHGVPIRIGLNAGSLEAELQEKYGEPTADALVESAQNGKATRREGV